jgi:DNA-binding MarR family transcriptional regulator
MLSWLYLEVFAATARPQACSCIYKDPMSPATPRSPQEPTASVDLIARTCIAVRLRLLNRVVTNLYDDALRPLGLKASQLNVLVVTAKLGLARPAKVCEILQLDASTLSRNVERMRAHGWLEVVPESDARAQPFRLTAQGKRLLERAFPAWEAAQRQAESLLAAPGIDLLDRAARKLRQAKVDR